MVRRLIAIAMMSLVHAGAAACGDDDGGATIVDAAPGSPGDAAPGDAAPGDAAPGDAAPGDAATGPDATAAIDATAADASTADAALIDATAADAALFDAALADAALMDAPEADAGDGCNGIGKACAGPGDCGPDQICAATVAGSLCVPARPDCGGFAGAMCEDPEAPICVYYTSADFGPCLKAGELACICSQAPGVLADGC